MKSIKELLVEKQVEKLIRKKYSLNDEFKMARKSHEDEEWVAYNTYVEDCIVKAKEIIDTQFKEQQEKRINMSVKNILNNIKLKDVK